MKKKTTNQVLKLKISTISVSMYRAAKVVLLLRECRRKQDPKTRPFFSKFKGKAGSLEYLAYSTFFESYYHTYTINLHS